MEADLKRASQYLYDFSDGQVALGQVTVFQNGDYASAANIVIYANQLLRAAYPAMMDVAETILKHGRSLEAGNALLPITAALDLIPGNR